jgi:N-acetylglucosaminyl-diphospho-decaprenol L-rhamnosyltransferase
VTAMSNAPPAAPPLSLDVVVVNWNTGDLLRRCVASASAALVPGVDLRRFVVVDNASADGSAERLEETADGLPLIVLRNAENRGFAAGCNQGAAGSSVDLVLFLNPDTELNAGSLAPVLAWLARPENARVGVAGIRLTDETGRTQRCCARVPTPWRLLGQALGLDRLIPAAFPPHFMTEWDHGQERAVDQVMGAFLLIRRSLFDSLGGFDERYFVYYDDVDLCLEARKAGWEVKHFAGAAAYHRGRGATDRIKDIRQFYLWRSRLRFIDKHFSPLGRLAARAAVLLIEPAVRLSYAAARGQTDQIGQTWRAMRLLWRGGL